MFLARRGLPADRRIIVAGASSRRQVHDSALGLLALDDRPTALLAEFGVGAVTALDAFRSAVLHVPEDMAIIGCGNVGEGESSEPPLTTVGPLSTSFSGRADHLVDVILGNAADRGRLFDVPWGLVLRGSA